MELPNGWANCALINICEVIAGQSPESQYYNQEGVGLPFFQGKADFGSVYPTNRVYCNNYKKAAQAGDVLLSVRAPVGPTNLSRENVAIGRGINAIRPLCSIDSWFILYYFKSIEPILSGVGTGTTFKAVTVDEVRNLRINLPPLTEQRRIVEKIDAFFSELDKGVELLQTIKEQLKTYRQSVLKWAFEGKLTGVTITETKYLQDVCFFITKGTTPPKNVMTSESGDVPFIKVYNLTFTGLLDFSIDPTYVPENIHNGLLARSKVYPGDVLMNIVGPPLGKVSIVPKTFPEYNINQAIARFRCNNDLDNKFLAYFLLFEGTIETISKKSKATAGQFNLTLGICRNIEIPFLPPKEQLEIVSSIESRLSVCDKLEQLVDENLTKADALRQSILKKAFEGRLIPQDPNDEPAEKLLERIKSERAATWQKPAKRRAKNG